VDEETIWSRLQDEILTPARRQQPESWDRDEREGASLSVPEAVDLALARGRFAPTAAADIRASLG
jgi:hypothetical protein